MRTIDGLIARHREACQAFEDAAELDGSDATLDPLSLTLAKAVDAIMDYRPSSVGEMRAKGSYLLELERSGADDFHKPELRRLLESLAA